MSSENQKNKTVSVSSGAGSGAHGWRFLIQLSGLAVHGIGSWSRRSYLLFRLVAEADQLAGKACLQISSSEPPTLGAWSNTKIQVARASQLQGSGPLLGGKTGARAAIASTAEFDSQCPCGVAPPIDATAFGWGSVNHIDLDVITDTTPE